MENLKCPVCGKPDVGDYHNEDVICPQCRSDLSIYRVIENIPQGKMKFNIWKPISAAAFLAAAVCAFFLISRPGNIPIKQDYKSQLALLQDTIKVLRSDLHQYTENVTSQPSFPYVIRKGDSYWSVSKKLYGTGTKANEIAEYNGRTLETPLIVGDTLKIK